jgi:hypothetical protein
VITAFVSKPFKLPTMLKTVKTLIMQSGVPN